MSSSDQLEANDSRVIPMSCLMRLTLSSPVWFCQVGVCVLCVTLTCLIVSYWMRESNPHALAGTRT